MKLFDLAKLSELEAASDTEYAEQGTSLAGYEEKGPYHCKDCIHKTGPDEPYCIHPVVLIDPKMKSRVSIVDGKTVAKVNLERGCCRFVKQ